MNKLYRGEYKRDTSDYQWLCRSCHMEGDGRMEKFKETSNYSKKALVRHVCSNCHRVFESESRYTWICWECLLQWNEGEIECEIL